MNDMNDPRMAMKGYAEREEAPKSERRSAQSEARKARVPAKLVVDPNVLQGENLEQGMVLEIVGRAEVAGMGDEGIEMAFEPLSISPTEKGGIKPDEVRLDGREKSRGNPEKAGRGESMDERIEFFRKLFGQAD